jgi:hypothetical protein
VVALLLHPVFRDAPHRAVDLVEPHRPEFTSPDPREREQSEGQHALDLVLKRNPLHHLR